MGGAFLALQGVLWEGERHKLGEGRPDAPTLGVSLPEYVAVQYWEIAKKPHGPRSELKRTSHHPWVLSCFSRV